MVGMQQSVCDAGGMQPLHEVRRDPPWQALRLLAWLAFLAAAVVGLTLLGRGPLGVPSILQARAWADWAAARDGVVIAFAALRLLTLVTAWYLLGVTVLGAVARLARWGGLVAVADILTVPAVRRLLQSALGVGLATAALTVGSPQGAPTPHAPTAATLTMTAEQESGEVLMAPLTADSVIMTPVGPDTGRPDRTQKHTTRPGDHFWSIASDVLTRTWGRPPDDAEIIPYWEKLVEVNRRRLADPANADLIYPGQEFVLPKPPAAPESRPRSRP